MVEKVLIERSSGLSSACETRGLKSNALGFGFEGLM